MNLILAPATERALNSLAQNPKGAYLFYGADGLGKATAAQELASQLARHASDVIQVEAETKSIGIEVVHELAERLRLQRVSESGQRIVVVDGADTLTQPAQNALLKLLEEPPAGTTIILIARQRASLLPTILSRCQAIAFTPVGAQTVQAYLEERFHLPKEQLQQLVAASQGAIGKAYHLANDPEAWQLLQQRQQQAESLLEEPLFDTLLLMQQLVKTNQLELTLEELANLLRRKLRQLDTLQNSASLRQCVRQLQLVGWAQRYLAANGNAKYASDRLALELQV